jgi:hypothetical protein
MLLGPAYEIYEFIDFLLDRNSILIRRMRRGFNSCEKSGHATPLIFTNKCLALITSIPNVCSV